MNSGDGGAGVSHSGNLENFDALRRSLDWYVLFDKGTSYIIASRDLSRCDC